MTQGLFYFYRLTYIDRFRGGAPANMTDIFRPFGQLSSLIDFSIANYFAQVAGMSDMFGCFFLRGRGHHRFVLRGMTIKRFLNLP